MKKSNLTNLLILLIGILTLFSCSPSENSNNDGSVEFCGKKYKTVVIGTQTWLAENVNCPTDDSRCYRNNPTYCSEYGRMYNWETAKTICPTGWHLPNDTEWETLVNYVGGKEIAGKKLKATSGWLNNGNGTDDYGFSALPGGYGSLDNGFEFVGAYGNYWSSSENDCETNNCLCSSETNYCPVYWAMGCEREYVGWDGIDKDELLSVRCVKN